MKFTSERESSLILGVILRIFDTVFIVAAARQAYEIYFDTWHVPDHYRLAYSMAALLVLTLFPVLRVYRIGRGSSRIDEIARVSLALGAMFLILALTAVLSKTSQSYSRVWFVSWFGLSVASFSIYRLVFHWSLRKIRQSGLDTKSVVLVGSSDQVNEVFSVIQKNKWMGLEVEAAYCSDASIHDQTSTLVPWRGSANEFLADKDLNVIDEIWICLPVSRAHELEYLLNEFSRAAATIRYIPDFFGFDLINHSVGQIGELPVVNLSVTPIQGWNRVLKWLEDKILSSLILLIISPLLIILSVGVKLSSPGPIFYRQERVSWNGRKFQMLKFRSMPVNNEANGVQWGGAQTKEVTPFGRFIRASSLDELPQFLNVLKGDMSVVGPRPERTVFVDQFKDEIPRYMQKHMVKAGITGWAQVHGWRGDTDLAKRIDYDMYYIENWSLLLDIKIIMLTIFKGFFNKNAY